MCCRAVCTTVLFIVTFGGTGVRWLARGLAILPQGAFRSFFVVKDKTCGPQGDLLVMVSLEYIVYGM